jgi:hypothetical protein
VRAEPRDDAEQVTQALRGEPLQAGEDRELDVTLDTRPH